MKVIGITGGVGAGKSQVTEYFGKHYGARTIIADIVAHKMMEPGSRGYYQVIEYFGSNILNGDMTINRGKLSEVVFVSRKKLEKLNGIIHPLVKEYIGMEIAREKKEKKVNLVVIEAALLIEDHYEVLCDELWYVYADEAVRRERLKASRGYTDERIDEILKNQSSDQVFRKHCKVVIDNSRTLEETYKQINQYCGG